MKALNWTKFLCLLGFAAALAAGVPASAAAVGGQNTAAGSLFAIGMSLLAALLRTWRIVRRRRHERLTDAYIAALLMQPA